MSDLDGAERHVRVNDWLPHRQPRTPLVGCRLSIVHCIPVSCKEVEAQCIAIHPSRRSDRDLSWPSAFPLGDYVDCDEIVTAWAIAPAVNMLDKALE